MKSSNGTKGTKPPGGIKHFLVRNLRIIVILTITLALHGAALLYINVQTAVKEKRKDNSIFKMVDVEEYVPPPPPPEPKKEIVKEDVVEIQKQDDVVEDVIETEKEIKELEVDYLPQNKISQLPVFPVKEIKSRQIYPALANKQGIEGVVYLELYIDQVGKIREIKILKEPGYGLGEAAVRAMEGIKCIPAQVNGVAVAVKLRFPMRFRLKR